MDKSEKPKITWFTAFKALSRGRAPAIGRYRGWKSLALQMAIVGPFVFCLVQGRQISIYSGAIPPNVPIIRGTGTFVEKRLGQSSWLAFVDRNGRSYNLERGTSTKNVWKTPQELPPPVVYVEGFFRENGSGYFWPLLIRTMNGQILLEPKTSISLLMNERRVSRNLLIFELISCVALILLSIFNLVKTKQRLISGS